MKYSKGKYLLKDIFYIVFNEDGKELYYINRKGFVDNY